jgi:hypothetical protein
VAQAYWEQTEPISTLNNLSSRKFSSQGYNDLDAPAFKTDGFLSRDTFISSTKLNRDMWKKESLHPPLKNLRCRKYDVQKLTQFSQGNNVLDYAASNIDGILWNDT